MRLIDADALIQKANYEADGMTEPFKSQIGVLVEWLVDKTTTIEPERTGKWIPLRERLPEDGKWCLFTDGVSMSVERYKEDALDHFFPEGRWFSLEDAVAWMPLSEPYREDN